VLAVLFVAFFALLVFSVPIAFAMAASAILALALQGQVPLLLVVQRVYAGSDSFPLMAIPFFLIAGEIMTLSRMTDALIELCDSLLSHLRSGLAIVTNVACTAFAAISGSGSADAAAIGSVMIPQLIARGYPAGMAAAIVSAAGALGPIIPPSILMIIYSAIAEQSVGRMFLGGILPGLTISAGLILVSHLMNLRHGWEAGSGERPSMARIRPALWRSLIPLGTPVIIVGGIVGGIFTATEAGVAACIYSLAVSLTVYRELTWRRFAQVLVRATLSSAMIMFLIGCASVLAWIVTRERVAAEAAAWIARFSTERWSQLLVINVFLLMVGCLIEGLPALLIMIPVMLPVALQIGVDPVHFGVILVFNILVGIITPPMGVGLFVVASYTGVPFERITRACIPFFIPLLLALMVITFVPELSLWLPRVLLG
jgi:C4-dicarboxylate transporter, DctM subunit